MVAEDRGPELLAIIWVFTALAIVIVTLKLFTRQQFLQGLGLDDFFIFLSLVLVVTCTSIFTYDVHLGMGKHASVLGDGVSEVVRINLIGNPFGIMAYSFPNISVAILLERLLAPNKLRTNLLYLLASLQVVIAAISCILLFVQCTPTASLWDLSIPATCFPKGTLSRYSYFVGSFTAFTDIVLGVVPIAAFWNLKLPTRSKVGLCILMGCTLFAAVCSIVKTTKLNELDDFTDFTHNSVDLIIWAIVEANVIIIAACMPTMRPFFRNTFQKDKEPVTEGRGFFRSLFSGSYGSGKSLNASKHMSGTSVPSIPSQHQPHMSIPARSRSSDSQGAIWCTTDIQQDTAPNEKYRHNESV